MNPKVSMWINIVLAALGYVAGAGAALTTLFGSGLSQELIAAAGLSFGILGSINTALHGISAPVAGPMLRWIRKGA